jgi:hypothetical protein
MRLLLGLISVLERKEEFSKRTRNKTDKLVENFLEELGDDIHDNAFVTIVLTWHGLSLDR